MLAEAVAGGPYQTIDWKRYERRLRRSLKIPPRDTSYCLPVKSKTYAARMDRAAPYLDTGKFHPMERPFPSKPGRPAGGRRRSARVERMEFQQFLDRYKTTS